MMKLLTLSCSLALTSLAVAGEDMSLSGHVEAGIAYDDNVSITEIESSAREGDSAWLLGGALKGEYSGFEKWTFSAGVKHQTTRYHTLSDYDLSLTTGSLEAKYDASVAKLGVHHYHADATLAGEGFLTYTQSGMSVGKAFGGGQGYWRSSADSITKRFDELGFRDADAVAFRTDGFWFFDAAEFVQVGVLYHDEDAVDQAFSYQSPGVSLSYQRPLSFISEAMTFNASYAFSKRDYEAAGDESEREDHRRRAEVSLRYPLMTSLEVEVGASHGNYQSSLISADYEETKAEMSVKWQF